MTCIRDKDNLEEDKFLLLIHLLVTKAERD